MNKLQTQFLALLALMLMGTGTANAATDYGIYVGETKVTSDNASNILGNGQFSYNASTKTLTVTNANLNNQGSLGSGIRNDAVDGLTIRLVGTSTLTTRMNAISSYKNFSITGTGTLNVTAGSRGIITYGQSAVTCTINGPTLNITASNYAFEDYYGTTTLSVKGADTRVTLNTGSTRNAVNNLKSFSVSDGLTIVYPQNATFDSSLKTIAYNGTACKGTVAIGITYGLYIGETMVNSYNYDDVNGDGMFAYRPNSKTLDVRSGTLTNTGSLGSGISNREIEGLTIHITGTTVNINARQNAIHSNKNFKITGPGTLNATSTNSSAIYFTSSQNITCTISTDANGKSPRINAKGYSYAIHDYYGTCTLALEGANTVLTLEPGTGYAAVNNLMNLTFADGLAIVSPTGGASPYFNSSLKTITVDGATGYKGKIEMAYDYGMYIGETRVSKINYTDILGNGQFKYDPSSKTLTVNNANLRNEGSLGNGIDNREIDGLTINLTGTSTITTRNSAIATSKSISIKGSGTLNATAQYAPGISFWGTGNKTCTVSGPKLNIISNSYYALDDNSGNTTLKLEGANTILTLEPGLGSAAVNNLKNLNMYDGLAIVTPTGPALSFYPEVKSISLNGREAYQGKVEIAYDYGMFVGETKVSKINYNDVLGNGQFKYNPDTKTLNVNNATLDNQGAFGNGIDNRDVDGLTINITGTSTIKARNDAITSCMSFSIEGSGTLNAIGQYGSGMSFWGTTSKTCTINVPRLNISSEGYYAFNDVSSNTTLTVNGTTTNVTLKEESGLYPTIFNLNSLSLGSGLYITKPADGKFSSSLKSITTDDETPYSGEVVISGSLPGPLMYIGDTSLTDDNASDILGDGTFSYERSTKTLFVRNANLTSDGILGSCISNREIEGLTIKFFGDNVLNARNSAIYSDKEVKITGRGKVVASSTEGYTLSLPMDATCTIDGIQLFLTGNDRSPVCDYYGTSTLKIEGDYTLVSMQTAEGKKPITNLSKLELGDGIKFIEPEGGQFSESLKAITVDGSTAYTGDAVIGAKIDYGIILAETIVTSYNCKDVFGNGQFSYDHATSTLTMKDAILDNTVIGPSEAGANQGTGISNWRNSGLNLVIEGINFIMSRNEAITSQESMTITGSGTLFAVTNESSAFSIWGQNPVDITVNGPTLDLTGAIQGINGCNVGNLIVEGTDTKITLRSGSDCPTIQNLNGLTLGRGLYLTKPAEGHFSESVKGVTIDDENLYGGEVVISSSRPILMYIGETELTRENADDILGDGQFKYDFDTKTLTVNNANLDNQGTLGSGISNRGIEGLTIKLIGENRLNCRMAAISSACDVTITGSGTLEAISAEVYALYLTGDSITCTIDGPVATFNGARWGLKSYKTTTTLNVQGSSTNVTFAGMEDRAVAISGLGHLNLGSGLQILTPQGGVFSESEMTIKANGEIASCVVIGKAEDTVKGDVNGDSTVDVADIASVISVMAGTAEYAAADVNGDGTTDVADIATIISIMAEQARLQKMPNGEAE